MDSISQSTKIDIKQQIQFIRGQQVILDKNLAKLHNITTDKLMEIVSKNLYRFPDDFIFQLSQSERNTFNAQQPNEITYAFSEHGIAMLSSVLKSPQSIATNIDIMRTFVTARTMNEPHLRLNDRLANLEQKYEEELDVVFKVMRELIQSMNGTNKHPIGFIS